MITWRRTALLLLLAFAPAVRGAESSCVTCHEDEKALFPPSAHGRAGLACTDCHGGNPAATDMEAHTAKDFQRPGTKQAIAELCASCHGDVRKMNPYGLPTDQLERYKTSKHGEQLFGKSDQNVATCTDCHGAHDIYSAKSPQSRTYPTRIPETCGRCHSDEKRMAPYKLPTTMVADYKQSHHATLLFEKGDLSAPTCVTCHGNHGAVPPGTREVGQVCGKCHVRQAELFTKSPHAEAAAAGAFSECISCHGNHAIKKASLDLFGTACQQCHATDEKPLARRDAIVALLQRVRGETTRAADQVNDATVHGLATEDEQMLLQEAGTQITQMEALQHTLSVDELRPAATRAENLVADILRGVRRLELVEVWKRRALVPVWVFLVAMAGLFWLKRRQVEKKG
jgi:hypothetical protein